MKLRRRERPAAQSTDNHIRALAENLTDAIVTIDEQSRIRFVNRAIERIFGYTESEVLGRSIDILMPSDLRAAHHQSMRHYLRTGTRHLDWTGVQLRGLHKNGQEIPIEVSFSDLRKNGKRFFTGAIRDITTRVRAERYLRAHLTVARIFAESASVEEAGIKFMENACEQLQWDGGGIWIVDKQANVLRCASVWYSDQATRDAFASYCLNHVFRRGEGLPGRVWENGRPLWVPDITRDPNFPRADMAVRAGLQSAFAFPISVSSEVIAAIELLSHIRKDADQEAIDVFTSMGRHLGQFIARMHNIQALTQQQEHLRLLSTPVLRVKDRLLIVPLIGEIDANRHQQLTQQLLSAIRNARALAVVIDLTGVATIKNDIASSILRTIQAARLLGAEVILTGVSRMTAQTLTSMDAAFADVRTRGDLQSGIEDAERLLQRAVA